MQDVQSLYLYTFHLFKYIVVTILDAEFIISEKKTYPHNKALLALWRFIVNGLPIWEKLKEYNTKRIYINFISHSTMHKVLRCEVSAR